LGAPRCRPRFPTRLASQKSARCLSSCAQDATDLKTTATHYRNPHTHFVATVVRKQRKKKGRIAGPKVGPARASSIAGAKSKCIESEEQAQRGRRASAAGANIKRSGSEEQAQRWCADALVSRRGGRRTHRLCAAVAHRRRPANARRARRARRANAPREPSQRTAGAERTRRGSRANALQRRVDLQTSQRFDKSARRPTDSHGSDGCGSDCDGDAGGGGWRCGRNGSRGGGDCGDGSGDGNGNGCGDDGQPAS
jgi:hypothetical protein